MEENVKLKEDKEKELKEFIRKRILKKDDVEFKLSSLKDMMYNIREFKQFPIVIEFYEGEDNILDFINSIRDLVTSKEEIFAPFYRIKLRLNPQDRISLFNFLSNKNNQIAI